VTFSTTSSHAGVEDYLQENQRAAIVASRREEGGDLLLGLLGLLCSLNHRRRRDINRT
jgi:hypothetical protein